MSGVRALASKELRQLAPTLVVLAAACVLALVVGLLAAAGPSEAPASVVTAALLASALLLGATSGTGDAAPAFEAARPVRPSTLVLMRLAPRLAALACLGILGITLLRVATTLTTRVVLPEPALLRGSAWWILAALMASSLASAFARRPAAALVHGAWIVGLLFLATTPDRSIGSPAGGAACLALGFLAVTALVARHADEASTRRRARAFALAAAAIAVVGLGAFFLTIALRNHATRNDLIRAWSAWETVAPAPPPAPQVSDDRLRPLHAIGTRLGFGVMPDERWTPDPDERETRQVFYQQTSDLMSRLVGAADPSFLEVSDETRSWLARHAEALSELATLLEGEGPILAAAARRDDSVVVPPDSLSLSCALPSSRGPHLNLTAVSVIGRAALIDALSASREGDVDRARRDIGAAGGLCREIGDGLADPASRITLVSCHREVLAVLRAMEVATPAMLDEPALAAVHERAVSGVVVTGRDYGQSVGAAMQVSSPSQYMSGPSPWWSPLREAARRFEHRRWRSVEASSLARELTQEPARVKRLAETSPCELAFVELAEGCCFSPPRDGWEQGFASTRPVPDLTAAYFMLRRAARLEVEAELTRVALETRVAPPSASDEVVSKLCPGHAWRRDVLSDGSIRVSCWREYAPDAMVYRPSASVSLVHVVQPRR